MQASELGHDVFPGANMEVVGVAQDHLGADGSEVGWRQCPNRSLRSYGHEGGSAYLAMRQRKRTDPGNAVLGFDTKLEHHTTTIASP